MVRRLRFEENVRKTLHKKLKTLRAYLRLKTTKMIFMCGFLTGGKGGPRLGFFLRTDMEVSSFGQ
jgi:hypothetical protein